MMRVSLSIQFMLNSVIFTDLMQFLVYESNLPSIMSGLVQAHMCLGKGNDALSAAKECLALAPRSPTALFAMASVLSNVKDGQKEVRDGMQCTAPEVRLGG